MQQMTVLDFRRYGIIFQMYLNTNNLLYFTILYEYGINLNISCKNLILEFRKKINDSNIYSYIISIHNLWKNEKFKFY